MTTVWVYVDTNHYVGHPDHLKVFATPDAADQGEAGAVGLSRMPMERNRRVTTLP
jgi:hypothetical protein